MNIILLSVVFLLSVEVLFWSFSINRHAVWLREHPSYDRRLAVPSKILAIGGWFTAIFAMFLWIWHVHSFALFKMCNIVSFDFYTKTLVVCWAQLSMIHLWGMIARYGCLHTDYWPILSGKISKLIIKRFGGTDVNQYCKTMRRWNELDRLSEQHRQLVFKFADTMKDFLWTKDTEKRYTYVNQAMCDHILLFDQSKVIGMSHRELSDLVRADGIKYNFDNISIKSDNTILREKKLTRFVERGIIDNKEVILHVLKAPIFVDGKLVGIIGTARDISFEVESLEKIELLIKAGEHEKAIKVFASYKAEFIDLKNFEAKHIEEV